MAAPIKEFFNLYVEYDSSTVSYNEVFETGAYTLLSEVEIYKYIDYIKEKKWGYQPIGTRKMDVVQPNKIQIFDLSKIVKDEKIQDFGKLEQVVQLKSDTEVPVLEQLRAFGKDVTATFNINLEEILDNEKPPVGTTETKTTTTIEEDRDRENSVTLNIDSNIHKSSSDNVELEVNIKQIFPNEYSEGIKDSSIEPAFEVKKVAKVFADHIKNLKDESGQMAGVFGQWGRGKSYFINEVFKIYGSGESSPFMMIKFQAWKYQNTQSIWAYLYETFIEEYLNVKWWNKWTRIFHLSINRNGHWKSWILPAIGICIGIFAFSFTSTLTEDSERQLIIKIAGFVATLAISIDKGSSILKKIKNPATSIFNSFSKAPSFKEVLGVQAEIQKELKYLIKAWSKKFKKRRILLFVDDLDRCPENQIIEIIDSLRVILDDELIIKHILIFVALDENKLEKAIGKKYENLFTKEELPEIVAEYMDKLFISAIKLFPISFDDRAEFVKKLAKQINLEENTEEELKTKLEPSPTPTPTIGTETNVTLGESPDSSKGTVPKSTPSPTPNPSPEVQKSSKNLEEVEVTMLQEKIKLTNKELTPRQIRILIYRYLLARNLWLVFFKGERFENEDAITEIMRFSGYNELDPKAKTQFSQGLSKIARMVVAY